ncbi:hypothetical protein LTR36_003189 [Oleoguttula mirabilis]|uniref:Uncharacterized protein n=1 Tax=Oleoguttula mirabilis TaxID=1507867 RepID=A0AAV9JWU6_9PEZI|nr:hypothetical protein LTR36_003189 [Oleoguttula mirabilis]
MATGRSLTAARLAIRRERDAARSLPAFAGLDRTLALLYKLMDDLEEKTDIVGLRDARSLILREACPVVRRAPSNLSCVDLPRFGEGRRMGSV